LFQSRPISFPVTLDSGPFTLESGHKGNTVLKRFLSAGFFALLFSVSAEFAAPQTASPTDSQTTSPFQISVSLNLVVLPATVRDKKGGFATDLRQENFEVFEDNVRQTVRLFRHNDIPVTAGLVVDHSGSMQKKLPDVLAAANAFVKLSNPQDQMFVVNFNERVNLGLPPGLPFTDQATELEAAIERAPTTGETALYDAIDVGLEQLKSGDSEKKVLIIISDGGDNASVIDLHQILKKAAQSDVMLYTIGIFDENDPDQNPAVLRRLAHETGGEAFFPSRFNEVEGICENIAREIRHQYTLGYVSTNTQPGGRRVVRVVARASGKELTVRTRSGYLAAGDEPKKGAGK
jgi:Ca-activated chloride channel homolog